MNAALDAGLDFLQVLISPRFLATREGFEISARLREPATELAADLLAELADADSPQGVLALAHLPRCLLDEFPIVPAGRYLLADGIQDPGNLGALARVAEAAGVTALCLSRGCAHPNHPRALRASAGSLLRLPVAIDTSAAELGRRLAPVSPRFVALMPRDGSDLYRSPLLASGDEGRALVLCVGSEGAGLARDTLAKVDLYWTIPMAPPVESLNVTVAAALALFELRRRFDLSEPPS